VIAQHFADAPAGRGQIAPSPAPGLRGVPQAPPALAPSR
jgi:hypothetical protein